LSTEKSRAIAKFALFAEVGSSDCDAIISSAREKRFARRETIFSEGDPVRYVIMLISGLVKVIQTGPNGNEVILRLNGGGEIVGSFRTSSAYIHCSTAQAVQPCVALIWDALVFERLLAKFPLFRRNTALALDDRLREMEERFRGVATEKVGCRLSGELIRLSQRMRHSNEGPFEITLSRAELAQLTGTTLFTVSRLLCQWQTLGIVKIRREAVLVQDVTALTRLSEGG
jgi:CRP/FNR family transcriptional regulator, nitrogen oxide reductase regulator